MLTKQSKTDGKIFVGFAEDIVANRQTVQGVIIARQDNGTAIAMVASSSDITDIREMLVMALKALDAAESESSSAVKH